MYEEDRIFGPLTFKQFLVAAFGAALVYYSSKILAGISLYVICAVIFVLVLLAIRRFAPKKIPVENLEMYFRNKRAGLSNENYQRLLKLYRIRVQSQIMMRMKKGMNNNTELVEAEAVLGRLINELKVN